MDYAKLELKLRKIVEKRIEEGWLFCPGLTLAGWNGARCCIVGAVGLEANPHTKDGITARRDALRWFQENGVPVRDDGWGNQIEWGFESFDIDIENRFNKIGARIRRDYCEFGDSK